MKFIIFLLMITSVSAQTSTSELCAQKKKQYGNSFVSCSEVDWGVTPISADYQPSNSAPMTAAPSQVNGYKNDYPWVKNTKYYNETSFSPDHPELKGLPLASKYISAVSADPKASVEDPLLLTWLSKDWYNSLQPKNNTLGWQGKCATWSAWSMDPELQKLFAGIPDGIICNGVPFSKGELKEVVTSLYPEPSMEHQYLSKFYFGYMGVNKDDLEDSNVALSKLGVFGQGDLGPAEVFTYAQKQKQEGKNMMMDRDPGSETWNQPIKKISDIAYFDEHSNAWQALSSTEFTTGSGTPKQIKFLSDLASTESMLTQNLLMGNGVSNNQLCMLRKEVDESCDDLASGAPITRSAQVDIFNRLKQSAFNKNILHLKQNVSIIKHEMIIEYGVENSFASNAPDKTVIQSYTYTSINSVNEDGSVGALIRSQWSPSISHLSVICKDPDLAKLRNSTSMTRGFEVNQKCAQGKAINTSAADPEYFTGAVPPKSFKSFIAKPQFTYSQDQQNQAYKKLLDFMKTCEPFESKSDYMKRLGKTSTKDDLPVNQSPLAK